MKFISIPIFLTSLALGLFVAYISSTPSQVVYVYPNPENQRKITYQDKAENCFHFQSKEVNCPKDVSKIRSYEIQ